MEQKIIDLMGEVEAKKVFQAFEKAIKTNPKKFVQNIKLAIKFL